MSSRSGLTESTFLFQLSLCLGPCKRSLIYHIELRPVDWTTFVSCLIIDMDFILPENKTDSCDGDSSHNSFSVFPSQKTDSGWAIVGEEAHVKQQ